MDSTVLGINESGLELLVKELEDAIVIINDRLTKLQSVYTSLGECCTGAQLVNDEFLNNINKTREAIEFNFDSYAKDLKTLQQRLAENDRYITTLFDEAAVEQSIKNQSFDNKQIIKGNKRGGE